MRTVLFAVLLSVLLPAVIAAQARPARPARPAAPARRAAPPASAKPPAPETLVGIWEGDAPGKDGPQRIVMTLTYDGKRPGGSILFPTAELGIEEATLSGRNLTFKTLRRVGGEVVIFNWTGITSADSIAFTYQDDFRLFPALKITLNRQP